MLREYAHGNRFALPLPSTPEQERGANGHFILFWILAGFLVILIRYYPMIPQFALRYYFNHTFFMQDIMEGRVRNPKGRSEEHTSELQSRGRLVCRLLLGKR